MKIILFLISNLIGFLSAGAAIVFALHFGLVPELPPELKDVYWKYLSAGTMISWMISAVISVFYLFTRGPSRFFFLSLPIIIPVIYAGYIINLYHI